MHSLVQPVVRLLLACFLGAPLLVVAQSNSAALPAPAAVVDPCKKDVLHFQEDLRTVRDTLGEAAAKKVQEDFLPQAQWNALLLNEGYCGIAKRLREKKLVR
ncbi:hypothetical protein [Rhodoferax aquaticus]|uniref:Uncharacterized protein n=1 Tax=Rhodoferax aquaticus TaxID=2527691 RepID=A0A515ESL6_9BURK|nr:hypothetical protein [Rhodoferax aquaticus]QDL55660.1 hypothetical protein EXZ61_16605 [Rhodoferax aquaticus]